MVVVAQLVRALDCGSRGRGFKSRLLPEAQENLTCKVGFFVFWNLSEMNFNEDGGK